jgi:hypothetical protein
MMASTAMTPPQEYGHQDRQGRMGPDVCRPAFAELDYSDAGYKGIVIWKDYEDALTSTRTIRTRQGYSRHDAEQRAVQTYDDKPKFSLWADKKRKRVRICQIWIKRDDEWYFAEFTKGGILKAGPSPYKDDKGESDDELIFQAAYKDRDNEPYGLVREMIPLQDEINKRRSKSLHLLSTSIRRPMRTARSRTSRSTAGRRPSLTAR